MTVVLAALHAFHGDHGHGVAHSGQRSVADGQGVGLHSADDSAGSGQLLCVLAAVLHVHDALEAVAGAGTGLTADQHDLAVVAADLRPVGDLAGEHLLELVHGQVRHLAVLIHDDGDAVQRHGGAVHIVLLVVLQGTGGQADVQGLVGGTGDACAGTGGVIADGNARLHLGKAFGQGGDNVLHGSGTAGGHIAAEGASCLLGSGRSGRSHRRSGGGSGRSGTAAGGEGSSSRCCTTNSQERTTRDLFHNIFLQIGPGSRPAAIYVVFVFFLGTALLYSSGSISSTMAGQNAGKSLGGRAGPLQRACKLAVKTVAPFFTLPEKLPKTILLPLGRTTKSPGHSFQSARGKRSFISSWV